MSLKGAGKSRRGGGGEGGMRKMGTSGMDT